MNKFNENWVEWQKKQEEMNRVKMEIRLKSELGETKFRQLKEEGKLPGQPNYDQYDSLNQS